MCKEKRRDTLQLGSVEIARSVFAGALDMNVVRAGARDDESCNVLFQLRYGILKRISADPPSLNSGGGALSATQCYSALGLSHL